MKYKQQKEIPRVFCQDWGRISHDASSANLNHLRKCETEAERKGENLLWHFFYLPVADGRAYYQIVSVKRTMVVVERCTGICPDEYQDSILGDTGLLQKSKAMQLVNSRKELEKLFPPRQTA